MWRRSWPGRWLRPNQNSIPPLLSRPTINADVVLLQELLDESLSVLVQDVAVLATSPGQSLHASTTRATLGLDSSDASVGGSTGTMSELGASYDADGCATDDEEAGPSAAAPPVGSLGPAVVDRLDSAHYEVRPAGLLERQDSAHEVISAHLLVRGRRRHAGF